MKLPQSTVSPNIRPILMSEFKLWHHLHIYIKHAFLQPATSGCCIHSAVRSEDGALYLASREASVRISSKQQDAVTPLNHIWTALWNLPHIRFTGLTVAHRVRNSPYIIKLEISLSCSQQPDTTPYPQPIYSSPNTFHLFNIHFNIITLSKLRSSKCFWHIRCSD